MQDIPSHLDNAQKELDATRGELDNLKAYNRVLLNQLFDANQRGHQVANALGFNDIYHAQNILCTSEPLINSDITYRIAIERAERRETELRDERDANRRLNDELRVIEQERDDLEKQLRSSKRNREQDGYVVGGFSGYLYSSPCLHCSVPDAITSPSERIQHLSLELTTLQSRYDTLLEVHERATERHKTDYTRWRVFKEWLFSEEKDKKKDRGNEGNETPDEKAKEKRRLNAQVMKKREMVLKMGPGVWDFEKEPPVDSSTFTFMYVTKARAELIDQVDTEGNKENFDTLKSSKDSECGSSIPPRKKRKLDADSILSSSPTIPQLPPSTTPLPSTTNSILASLPEPLPPNSPLIEKSTLSPLTTPTPSSVRYACLFLFPTAFRANLSHRAGHRNQVWQRKGILSKL